MLVCCNFFYWKFPLFKVVKTKYSFKTNSCVKARNHSLKREWFPDVLSPAAPRVRHSRRDQPGEAVESLGLLVFVRTIRCGSWQAPLSPLPSLICLAGPLKPGTYFPLGTTSVYKWWLESAI